MPLKSIGPHICGPVHVEVEILLLLLAVEIWLTYPAVYQTLLANRRLGFLASGGAAHGKGGQILLTVTDNTGCKLMESMHATTYS